MNSFPLSTCRYVDIWQYTYGSYTSVLKLSTMRTNTPMSAVVVTVIVVLVVTVVVDINDNNK